MNKYVLFIDKYSKIDKIYLIFGKISNFNKIIYNLKLSNSLILPKKFIIKYLPFLYQEFIFRNYSIDNEIIKPNVNIINWDLLTQYSYNINDELVINYFDKFPQNTINNLIEKGNLSCNIRKKYNLFPLIINNKQFYNIENIFGQLTFDKLVHYIINYNISENAILKILDFFDDYKIANCAYYIIRKYIIQHQNLSIDFIDKNFEKLNSICVFQYFKYLPENLIEKHYNKYLFLTIIENQKITNDFFKKLSQIN